MFTLYTYTQVRCDECGATTDIAPGKIEKIELNCNCKKEVVIPKAVRKTPKKKVEDEK